MPDVLLTLVGANRVTRWHNRAHINLGSARHD
jgi:hypothetical protein